jgi:hypothetical protein
MGRSIASFILFYICFSFAAMAQVSITPKIDASQIIGVAPMPIFFDATATAINDSTIHTFHDLHYQWNFGDFFSGAWHTKTKSKNRASSPLAVHIFDSVGLHIVELEVFQNAEYSALKTFIVKIQDASDFYKGEKTVCFSTTGEFPDAPYNAQLVTIQNLEEVQPYVKDSTRLLFRRGQTIPANIGLDLSSVNHLTIGAFGVRMNLDENNRSENAPIIQMYGDGSLFKVGNTDTLQKSSNIKITELHLVNSNINNLSPAIFAAGETSKNLLYRLKIEDFGQAIFYDYSLLEYFAYPDVRTVQLFEEIIISECIINNRNKVGDLVHINGQKLAFIGNNLNNFKNKGNVLNISWGSKVIVNNNTFLHPGSFRNTLKITGPNRDFCITERAKTHQIIITDNHFESQLGVREVIRIHKDNEKEGLIEDVIVDRNFISTLQDEKVRCGLVIGANGVSIRNNIINGTGSNRWQFTGIYVLNDYAKSGNISNIKITNNTIFKQDWINLMTGVRIGENIENTFVANNLVYSPLAMDIMIVDDNGLFTTEKHNIYPIVHPFVENKPVQPLDFQLDSISVVLDKGTSEQLACRDYFENVRSQNNRIDVGALQFTKTPITAFDFNKLSSSNILEYPYPVRSYFTMDLSKFTAAYNVEIFNSEGEMIHEDKSQRNTFYIWQTQNHQKGIYWLKISSKDATLMTKVLIDR